MMATNETNTVVAFFDEHAKAQTALDQLEQIGVTSDQVTMLEGSKPGADGHSAKESGFLDSLKDMFMPAEDKQHYAEGLRRGGYMVSVRSDAGKPARVIEILDADGSIDMDERSGQWRSEGWSGDEGGTIELAEEQMRIGKRNVDHGSVRVRSYTVEEEVSQEVPLRHETVRVERQPADRLVKDADAAFQDRTVEVDEVVEEAVVSKETRVVEEIEIARKVETETQTVGGTVRHTEVEVEDTRKP
jgi:uncharacterized protein (TIGR02271 family)